MSRHHCSIWYKSSSGELYVQSQTENPLVLMGHDVESNGKAKVDFDQPISLVLGKTTISIEPAI